MTTYAIYTNRKNTDEMLGLVQNFFDVMGDHYFVYNNETLMIQKTNGVLPEHGFMVDIKGKLCYNIFDVVYAYKDKEEKKV